MRKTKRWEKFDSEFATDINMETAEYLEKIEQLSEWKVDIILYNILIGDQSRIKRCETILKKYNGNQT